VGNYLNYNNSIPEFLWILDNFESIKKISLYLRNEREFDDSILKFVGYLKFLSIFSFDSITFFPYFYKKFQEFEK
jgi:hypothetical protein